VYYIANPTCIALYFTFCPVLIVGKVIGDTILYFGCRKKAEDFIYEEELNEYVEKGVLTVSYLMHNPYIYIYIYMSYCITFYVRWYLLLKI